FVGYGKGYLQDFPGRPEIICDLIPCDHVVNAILAAAPRCAAERGFKVYQVATGEQNPVQFRTTYNAGKDHFTRNPMRDRDGKLIPHPEWTWPDPKAYRRKIVWRYITPLRLALALLRPLSFLRPLDKLRRRLAVPPDGLGEEKGVPVRTIPGRLARSAARFPEAVALQMKRGGDCVRLTVDGVERRVREAALALELAGVHRGDRVLLYAENRPEWGVAYLAVVSRGAVVVPVDRQLDEQELLAVARLVEARAVLASDGTYHTLSAE